MSISHYIFIPISFVLLVLSLVISGDPVQGVFGGLIAGIVLCGASVLVWKRKAVSLVPPSTILIGGLFVALSIVSAAITGFSKDAFFGSTIEWGTIASLCLFSVFFFLGSATSKKGVSVFLWSIEAIGSVLALIAACTAAGLIPLAVIAPSWVQVSFIVCTAALVAAARADAAEGRVRVYHLASAAVSFVGFVILFIPEAGMIALAVSLLVAYRATWPQGRRFPYVSVLIALAILLPLAFSSRVPIIPLASDDRPTLYATSLTVGAGLMSSQTHALIGAGPHSFSSEWDKYRLIEDNASPYWKFTPKYPYSALSTLTLEGGAIQMFAFILFLLIPLEYLWRKTDSGGQDFDQKTAISACALFLILSAFVSPLGMPILLIAAFAVGMCAASQSTGWFVVRKRPWIQAFAVTVLVGGVAFLLVSSLQICAARADSHGLALLNENNAEAALPFFARAVRLWETSEYDQDLATAHFKKGLAERRAGSLEASQQDMYVAAGIADRAAEIDRDSFSRWIFAASFYYALEQADITGIGDNALYALHKAEALSPTRPEVPYTRALIALKQNDVQEALAQLDKAIALKPDYEEALILRMRLTPVK